LATTELRRKTIGLKTGHSRDELEIFGSAEGADHGGNVALVGVNLGVEAAHFVGGDLVVEIGEGGTELREFGEGGLANDGDGVVGREIVAVVLEGEELESSDEAVGGVAGDDIHLMIDEGAIEEAEVHDVGIGSEVEMVAVGPAAEAVGTLEEFVASADAELGGNGHEVGHGVEMVLAGIGEADDHGKGVGEAERFGEVEVELLGVLLFDAIVNGRGVVGAGRFVEDGGEGSAGVFDVEVEVAGEESFVDEEGTAEIGFALDGDAGAGFDVLGEEFGENDLLGEEFGANGQVRRRGLVAGSREAKEVKEIEEVKDGESGSAHVWVSAEVEWEI